MIEKDLKKAKKGKAQPSTIWAGLQLVTGEEVTTTSDMWVVMKQRVDPSLKKPKCVGGTQISRHHTSKGETYYVLNNPQANTYLKIDDRDYFLWKHMDGEHTVRDLAVVYFSEFEAFPFDRLVDFLGQLKTHQLLSENPEGIFELLDERTTAHNLAYRLQRFSEQATQREFSLKNADRFFDTVYRLGGRLLFTRPALIIYGLLILAGMAFFIRELLTGKYPLLSTAGSFGLGLILLLMIYYVMTFFHECGHALTCKHYGRKVTKGGLLLYMGSPAFFVDTTDIWMAPKQARIMVSLAGPLVTLVLGSLVAVLAGLFPTFSFNEVLFKAALIGYVSALINLNPLLELDGYYVLTDWLEIPLLRKKSFTFVRKELPTKIFKEWSNFSREEKIYSLYGIAAAVFTGFTIVYVVYLWQREIRVMEQDFLSGRNILDVIIVGGLMLVAGANLILGLTIKALLFAGERSAQMRKYIQKLHKKAP